MPKQMKYALVACALAFAPINLGAQLTLGADEVVDRVVAIVGDSVILQSQIDQELQRLSLMQGVTIPESGPEREQVQREILDQYVNLMLVLQAAAKDTLIRIDESLIEERVTQQIESVTQQLGGGPALQQALAQDGWTLAEYRDFMRNQLRQTQTQQLFFQTRLQQAPQVDLSEDELLQAFQAARGRLQQRPKLITFEQVVLKPEPSQAAQDSARAQAEAILAQLRDGADFEALALEHSDDPGSAASGGDLGWFRRGAMVPEFEQAAFALVDGQTSGVVETEYGYHVIRVERSRRAERRGRHILISPEVAPSDLQAVRDTAASVAEQARAGVSMSELFDRYADPESPDSLTVSPDQIASLPPGYNVLAGASSGEVVGPIEYVTGQGQSRVSVVRVKEVREAGAFTFEDVRGQLVDQLRQQKQVAAIVEELKAKTHIEIRG